MKYLLSLFSYVLGHVRNQWWILVYCNQLCNRVWRQNLESSLFYVAFAHTHQQEWFFPHLRVSWHSVYLFWYHKYQLDHVYHHRTHTKLYVSKVDHFFHKEGCHKLGVRCCHVTLSQLWIFWLLLWRLDLPSRKCISLLQSKSCFDWSIHIWARLCW